MNLGGVDLLREEGAEVVHALLHLLLVGLLLLDGVGLLLRREQAVLDALDFVADLLLSTLAVEV